MVFRQIYNRRNIREGRISVEGGILSSFKEIDGGGSGGGVIRAVVGLYVTQRQFMDEETRAALNDLAARLGETRDELRKAVQWVLAVSYLTASLMKTSMERGTLSAEEVERVFDEPIQFLRSEGEQEAVNWLTQLRESFFAPKTR